MKRLQYFFNNSASSGILLIIAAAIAIVLANIKLTCNLYHTFLSIPIELKIGTLEIKENVLLWINDALMAIFFLLVGLEIKRELIAGSMANFQKAIFPVFVAIGGMIIPALIYLAFNFQDPVTHNGWAIPTATDIAFALGILTLLGSRVPVELKIFLMSLATIDDLGTIAIVTVFYTNKLSMIPLEFAAISIIILWILNFYNVRYITIYVMVGVVLWISILKSGVHPTITGIIISIFVPLKDENGESPSKRLEGMLYPCVAFLILPLFAFANAGISLQGIVFNKVNFNLLLGIISGLFIGKPLGICLFYWIALKFKFITLPKGTTHQQIIAVGILCGIGFTMSIFISTLAFSKNTPELIVLSKFGILIGSFLSALFGYFLLKKNTKSSISEFK